VLFSVSSWRVTLRVVRTCIRSPTCTVSVVVEIDAFLGIVLFIEICLAFVRDHVGSVPDVLKESVFGQPLAST
jgi:hypothetical protein